MSKLAKDGGVGNVESFRSPEVMVSHLGSFLSLNRLRKLDIPALDKPKRKLVVHYFYHNSVADLLVAAL